MNHGFIPGFSDTFSSHLIPLLVLVTKIESQSYDYNDQQSVTTKVCREGDEISGAIPVEEDLGSWNLVSVKYQNSGKVRLPIALPAAQMMKFVATTTVFFV